MRCRNGYLLIELLIVFSLFIFCATVMIYHKNYLHRLVVRAELEKLYTTCIYLRAKAVTDNKELMLHFDQTKQNYSYGTVTEHLPKLVQFGSLKGAEGPPSTANLPINSPITFVQQRIIFYPTGIIQSGTIYLVDRNKTVMYALSNPVSHVSFLRRYRYDGAWHQL